MHEATQRAGGGDLPCQLDHPLDPADVHLARLRERQIEGDGRGAVDDPVDRRHQPRAVLTRQPQRGLEQVAAHDGDAGGAGGQLVVEPREHAVEPRPGGFVI